LSIRSAPYDVTAGPAALSRVKSAAFGFTGIDEYPAAVPVAWKKLDGAATPPCRSTQSYAISRKARTTFAVRAVDRAGNVDASPASYTWFVERSRRTPRFAAHPGTVSNSVMPLLLWRERWDPAAAPGAFEISPDGGAFVTASGQHAKAMRDFAAAHTPRGPCGRAAGNVDASPRTMPGLSIRSHRETAITFSPPRHRTSETQVSIHGTDSAGSGVDHFEVSLDGSAFETANEPHNYTGLGKGAHTFGPRGRRRREMTQSPAEYGWTSLRCSESRLTAHRRPCPERDSPGIALL